MTDLIVNNHPLVVFVELRPHGWPEWIMIDQTIYVSPGLGLFRLWDMSKDDTKTVMIKMAEEIKETGYLMTDRGPWDVVALDGNVVRLKL